MKLLNKGWEIQILNKTEDVIGQIAAAARTCYQSQEFSTPDKDTKLVKHLIDKQHGAMLEFADLTIVFKNVSRGLTHELVRHRHCSFAQESTRYVDERDISFTINDNMQPYYVELGAFVKDIENLYVNLKELGLAKDDIRQVLPTGIAQDIVVKANLREWRHIFELRCNHDAHWEIREVMLDLLTICKAQIPVVFDDFQFFEATNGRKYAKKVYSISMLEKEIKHRIMFDESSKEKLIEYINSL